MLPGKVLHWDVPIWTSDANWISSCEYSGLYLFAWFYLLRICFAWLCSAIVIPFKRRSYTFLYLSWTLLLDFLPISIHFFTVCPSLFLFIPVLRPNHFSPLYLLSVFPDAVACNICFFTVNEPAFKFASLISQSRALPINRFLFTAFPIFGDIPASLKSLSVFEVTHLPSSVFAIAHISFAAFLIFFFHFIIFCLKFFNFSMSFCDRSTDSFSSWSFIWTAEIHS